MQQTESDSDKEFNKARASRRRGCLTAKRPLAGIHSDEQNNRREKNR
jgi:hypothetical protein